MSTTDVEAALSRLDAVKDTMNVRRAFGDPVQMDGVTVIPVAKVGGGGGGGGGEGGPPNEQKAGSGTGVGFGVGVKPLGVYAVKDGQITWQPAIDVMRIVLGGQIVAIVAILAVRSVLRAPAPPLRFVCRMVRARDHFTAMGLPASRSADLQVHALGVEAQQTRDGLGLRNR